MIEPLGKIGNITHPALPKELVSAQRGGAGPTSRHTLLRRAGLRELFK